MFFLYWQDHRPIAVNPARINHTKEHVVWLAMQYHQRDYTARGSEIRNPLSLHGAVTDLNRHHANQYRPHLRQE